jgi:hypothetical protein
MSSSDIKYLITLVAIVMFYTIELFVIRLFNLSIPSTLVPWSAPFSKTQYFSSFFDLLLISSLVFDPSGRYSFQECLVLFLL